MNYLLICSPDNYQITRKTGVIGYYDALIIKSGQDFLNVQKGEKIFIYVAGKKVIDAVAEVTKEYYFDEKPLFISGGGYRLPHRIGVMILKEQIGLDFKSLVNKLDMIKDKTGRVVYSAYFVKSFLTLSEHDNELLSSATGV